MSGRGASEFRRGWPLLLGSFVGIAAGVSSLYFYSLGLFLKPVAAEFGWSRGAASLGPLVGTLGAALASAPTGRLLDRVGPFRTAIGSSLFLAAGFAVLGVAVSGIASFLLTAFVMSLLTVGSSPLSYSRLIIGAFDRRRGLALGLALTATGIGAILLPVLLSPYIAAHGWRAAYLLLAGVALAATVPVGLLLRGNGDVAVDRKPLPPLSAVTGQPAFHLLGAVFLLAAIGVLGTVVHFPAMLSDAGMSPVRAGVMAGSIGIAVIAGRGIAGALLDRFRAGVVTASFFAISAAGLVMLALGGVPLALPAALAIGVSVGAEIDLIAYLVSRLFPRDVYGTAYGGIYGLFLLGGAIGPAMIGALFDATGSYRVPMFGAAACLTAAAALAMHITEPIAVVEDRAVALPN